MAGQRGGGCKDRRFAGRKRAPVAGFVKDRDAEA
jgi:hypothetical protein